MMLDQLREVPEVVAEAQEEETEETAQDLEVSFYEALDLLSGAQYIIEEFLRCARRGRVATIHCKDDGKSLADDIGVFLEHEGYIPED